MKRLHLAIGSTTSKPGAVTDNLRQIADFAAQAGRDGVDLLLTPELSASGYGPYPEVLATAEVAGEGPIYRELARLAQQHGVAIAAGFVEASAAKRYLAHYVVHPDGAFAIQRKNRVMLTERPLDPVGELIPPAAGDLDQDPANPGQPRAPHFHVFLVRGVRCTIAICADSGITGIDAYLNQLGVEVLLVPTGAGGQRCDRVDSNELQTVAGREKYHTWIERCFFPGRSIITCLEHRRAMAAVNLCGYDGKAMWHIGHGMIVSAMGEVPALIHGLPNIDRQRPLYAHALIDCSEHLP